MKITQLAEALDVLCHWSFHETGDALNHSTEFYEAVQFLEQSHRGILRLFIHCAHDFRIK